MTIYYSSLFTQEQKILFIGNGLTGYSLRQDFLKLSKSAGQNVVIDHYTPDSYILSFHNGWLGDETSIEKIAEGESDVVVLQEHSFFPLVPILRDSLTLPSIDKLVSRIQTARNCTKIILFLTWAWPNGGKFCSTIESLQPSCSPAFIDYFHMQDSLEKTYLKIAESLDVSLAPVGAAWRSSKELYPELDLFVRGSNLANEFGSYLSACVLFSTIFKESPVGNHYASSLTSNETAILQKIAEQSVLDRPQEWKLDPSLPHVPLFDYKIYYNKVQFINQSQNGISYSWEFGDGGISNETDPYHTYRNFGEFDVCLQLTGVDGCPKKYCRPLMVKNSVSVYPNPFRSELILDFESDIKGPVLVEMYDMSGERFGEWRISDIQDSRVQLNILKPSTGTYLLKITLADCEIKQKIIRID